MHQNTPFYIRQFKKFLARGHSPVLKLHPWGAKIKICSTSDSLTGQDRLWTEFRLLLLMYSINNISYVKK